MMGTMGRTRIGLWTYPLETSLRQGTTQPSCCGFSTLNRTNSWKGRSESLRLVRIMSNLPPRLVHRGVPLRLPFRGDLPRPARHHFAPFGGRYSCSKKWVMTLFIDTEDGALRQILPKQQPEPPVISLQNGGCVLRSQTLFALLLAGRNCSRSWLQMRERTKLIPHQVRRPLRPGTQD
jgi:hypothetical protein